MVNSRSLSDLHPTVRKMAEEFIKKCKEAGIDVIITSTLRDFAYQDSLYAQGRTVAGKKVTNAKAGHSMHNYGYAMDFAPTKGGRIDWNDLAAFKKCGLIGESLGFTWAYRFKSFPELAHLEFTGGLTLKELQSGKRLP